jgi:hypothetical protein
MVFYACSKKDQIVPAATAVQDDDLSQANSPGHKRIVLQQWSDKGLYLNGKKFSYKPGDTLVLKGSWNYLSLENFYGTPSERVIIINEGSQVKLTSGFSFTNCRYMRLLGQGTKDKYGFRVEQKVNDGVGVSIQGRSAYIEIANVDVYNKTYGYWVKQEASCIDSLQYPNWVINHIRIHDGRIRKVNQEGMYMGSTDPNGIRSISCNGKIISPKPLRLGNIRVFNMIIDSTNRSGIQLSCGSEGENLIHDNIITNCGYEFQANGQGCGISLGGYTTARVYNNTINNTFTAGMMCLGAGPLIVENNSIKNSGKLGTKSVKGMASIMVDTRPTSPADSTKFNIHDNVLGDNTDVNVRVYKTYNTYAKGNKICQQGNSIAVVSGIDWNKCQ